MTFVTVTQRVTKRRLLRLFPASRKVATRCLWCGVKLPRSSRGRSLRYCTRSHRQRAYELRQKIEREGDLQQALKGTLFETLKRHHAAELEHTIRVVVEKTLVDHGLISRPPPEKPPRRLKIVKRTPTDS